jgi:hypothetical protein
MKALEVGEQYLTIVIAGHLPVVAFKNKDKKGKEPDYKAGGIGVWINTKKDSKVLEDERLL